MQKLDDLRYKGGGRRRERESKQNEIREKCGTMKD